MTKPKHNCAKKLVKITLLQELRCTRIVVSEQFETILGATQLRRKDGSDKNVFVFNRDLTFQMRSNVSTQQRWIFMTLF